MGLAPFTGPRSVALDKSVCPEAAAAAAAAPRQMVTAKSLTSADDFMTCLAILLTLCGASLLSSHAHHPHVRAFGAVQRTLLTECESTKNRPRSTTTAGCRQVMLTTLQ